MFVALVRGCLRGAGLATPEEMAAIDAVNDRLQAEGHWVFAGGLASPSTSTVVDNRRGEAVFTDGPFVESKRFLAGFWILEAPDLDVALKLATEGSKAQVDGPDLEVALTPAWNEIRGEVAVRDPLDSKGKRATTSVPVGTYRLSRYVDPTGRPELLAVGAIDRRRTSLTMGLAPLPTRGATEKV